MPDLAHLAAYLAAAVVLVLAPGPGQMLVLARSLGDGRAAGVVTSLGLNTGTLVHTLAAAFGLSAVLATSAIAFAVVKGIGAIYLVYLGIQALRARRGAAHVEPESSIGLRRTFTRAVVTGIFNPKVALFFLALLPQFVQPERGRVLLQFLVLGLILASVGFCWDCLLASAAGSLGAWIERSPRFEAWRQRVMGFVFISLGVHLALVRG